MECDRSAVDKSKENVRGGIYSSLDGKDDVLMQNGGFTDEALEIDVCSVTIVLLFRVIFLCVNQSNPLCTVLSFVFLFVFFPSLPKYQHEVTNRNPSGGNLNLGR